MNHRSPTSSDFGSNSPDSGAKQRVLNIEGVINFRDLGGYANAQGQLVKWGKCYRSGQLDRMTEQGVAQMSALAVQTVIDLRFADETERFPTMQAAFADAQIIAWQDNSDNLDVSERSKSMQMSWQESLESNDAGKVREVMRVNYPKKLYSHRAIYRTLLLKLIAGDTPLVFHCAAGKDRTGVAAALILSLLGVSNQVIVEDYLLTQQQIGPLFEYWMSGGAVNKGDVSDFQQKLSRQSRTVVQPVFDADVAYIETLLEYVAQQYGSFENYAIEKLQLDQAQLAQLRTQLLQDDWAE